VSCGADTNVFKNREQDKFRDFFTKELNSTKAELAKVEKENQRLVGKRLANNKKKTDLVNTVRFKKTIDQPAKDKK
jgi:hypothetical protein